MSIEYPIYEQFNNAGTLQKQVVGQTITAAATVAPTYRVHPITGATSVVNITLPWSDFGGNLTFVCLSAISWTAAGNIVSAGNASSGSVVTLIYNPATAKFYPAVSSGAITGGSSAVQTLRVRATTAEANAGTFVLIPAVTGLKIRLIDFTMIAIGGNAATATSVRITATQSASAVHLFTILIAALTRSTLVKGNSANVAGLADGACLVANDVSTAVLLTVDNNNLATATGIDTILTFVLDT